MTALVNHTEGVLGSLPAPSHLSNILVANAEEVSGCPSDLHWSLQLHIRVFGRTFQAALNLHNSALEDAQINGAIGGGVWK